jgi:hypothetical protein
MQYRIVQFSQIKLNLNLMNTQLLHQITWVPYIIVGNVVWAGLSRQR